MRGFFCLSLAAVLAAVSLAGCARPLTGAEQEEMQAQLQQMEQELAEMQTALEELEIAPFGGVAEGDADGEAPDGATVIEIDLEAVAAGDLLYLEPHTFAEGDRLVLELEAEGDGVLSTGFAPGDDPAESLWPLLDFDRENRLEGEMVFGAELAGEYRLWIANTGEQDFRWVRGVVTIFPATP